MTVDMSRSPKQQPQTTKQPVKNPALLLTMTALDTTWRTFVPVIGGTILGVAIDNRFDLSPITTIIGLIVGIVIAGLLIKKQLEDVNKPL